MSYSRQTCPASFGRVPLPAVTLAIAARCAVATGCKPALLLLAAFVALPLGRHAPVESPGIADPGLCAESQRSPPGINATTKHNLKMRTIFAASLLSKATCRRMGEPA